MFKFNIFALIIFSFLIVACSTEQNKLKTGKDSFIFNDKELNPNISLKVYTYKPTKYNENSKILFVMHGNRRNPDVYRNQWAKLAEKYNALLICPGFSNKYFPLDQDYNMGHMFAMNKHDSLLSKNPKNIWSYSYIEPIFDYVKKMEGNKNSKYLLYGHSAGAQFVHRFLMFVPNARIERAVSANAGWYTFPDFNKIFPYGLKNTSATLQSIKKIFAKNLTILLGTADTIRTGKALRRTSEAMEQGAYRLQRGKNFYAYCKNFAEKNNVDFKWKLAFVKNVGHSNKKMEKHAAKILFK